MRVGHSPAGINQESKARISESEMHVPVKLQLQLPQIVTPELAPEDTTREC